MTKIYRNPERNKPQAHQQYVPQYKSLGVKPVQQPSRIVEGNNAKPVFTGDNPRLKIPVFDVKQSMLPNVGAEDWMEENVDPNHPMIDNNEFVSYQSLGAQDPSTIPENNEDLLPFLHSTEEGVYTLIVGNTIVKQGSLQEVEAEASLFIFGEHEFCNGNPVPVEEILILKKIRIKTGLFLEG